MSFRQWFGKSPRSMSRLRSKWRDPRVELLEDRSTPATITGGTGPGGFELANGAATLSLWLDATDVNADGAPDVIANGSTVNTWDDRSGFNRDATLVNGTPFYVASSAPGNNMPSIGFNTTDGTPDNLRTAFNFDGANL